VGNRTRTEITDAGPENAGEQSRKSNVGSIGKKLLRKTRRNRCRRRSTLIADFAGARDRQDRRTNRDKSQRRPCDCVDRDNAVSRYSSDQVRFDTHMSLISPDFSGLCIGSGRRANYDTCTIRLLNRRVQRPMIKDRHREKSFRTQTDTEEA
jgi:hypothetical protein